MAEIKAQAAKFPDKLDSPKADRYLQTFQKGWPAFEAEVADTLPAMKAWNWQEPVKLSSAITGFLTGKDWITGGEWSDFYGVLPLLGGLLDDCPGGAGAGDSVRGRSRDLHQPIRRAEASRKSSSRSSNSSRPFPRWCSVSSASRWSALSCATSR